MVNNKLVQYLHKKYINILTRYIKEVMKKLVNAKEHELIQQKRRAHMKTQILNVTRRDEGR